MAHNIPLDLPAELQAYARGETHSEPARAGYRFADIKKMRQYRTAFLRNLLQQNPRVAWGLPDFTERMVFEIKTNAKRTLLPALFKDFDAVLRDAPTFQGWYWHEYNRLLREYQRNIDVGNTTTRKLRYLHNDAIRHVFADSLLDGARLGELELACFGELRYGY